MKAEIRAQGPAIALVPATILGQNLEMAGDTAAGLATDRLSNSRFLGPADPTTGLAPGWQPGMSHNCPGVRFELTAGMSLSGYWSQLIHNYSGRRGVGMLQTRRWVRAGERLAVTLWARAQHRPATLRVGLRPLGARELAYDEQDIRVEATYWRRYETLLSVPKDDDEAVFGHGVAGPDPSPAGGSRHDPSGSHRVVAGAGYARAALPGWVYLDQLSLAFGHGAAASETRDARSRLQVGYLLRVWD